MYKMQQVGGSGCILTQGKFGIRCSGSTSEIAFEAILGPKIPFLIMTADSM